MSAADPPARSGASGRFQTTHWSVVLRAGEPHAAESREALTRLCELYWRPVHAYIRRRVATDDEARDLTQAFFTLFLEKHYVRDADPARGRFRAFMLASVKHFLSNDRDRAHALKRGGWTPIVSLEFETAEGSLRHEPATQVTPERLYEHRWAWAMVSRVLERLETEQAQAGHSETFGRLRPFLSGDEPGMPYAELASLLDTSPVAIRVAVHRLRRRFRALLLEEVARTVADPADIEPEVRYLIEALRTPDERDGSKGYV
jgi:DNA-directed RNA polymerase specialized sigma24 family protein